MLGPLGTEAPTQPTRHRDTHTVHQTQRHQHSPPDTEVPTQSIRHRGTHTVHQAQRHLHSPPGTEAPTQPTRHRGTHAVHQTQKHPHSPPGTEEPTQSTRHRGKHAVHQAQGDPRSLSSILPRGRRIHSSCYVWTLSSFPPRSIFHILPGKLAVLPFKENVSGNSWAWWLLTAIPHSGG